MPRMTRNQIVIAVLALWALCFVAGFGHAWITAPTGDGFHRGMNRIGLFFFWQAVAIALALLLLALRVIFGARLSRAVRWLALLPITLSGVLLVVLIGAALVVGVEGR